MPDEFRLDSPMFVFLLGTEFSGFVLDAAMDIALEYAPSFSRSLQRIKKEALERRSASRHIIRRLELIPSG